MTYTILISLQVQINVQDANDNAPIFYNNKVTYTVEENSKVKEAINISAFDIDLGVNAQLNYSIITDTGKLRYLLINTDTIIPNEGI